MRAIRVFLAVLVVTSCNSSGTPAGTEPTLTSSSPDATSPPGEVVSVARVLDGDSLRVASGGNEIEVRLLGINAPEGTECHGDKARETLEQLLEGGDVTMVAADEDSDQFDRLLRYVFVDGLNVNLALIANGDALAIQGDHPLDSDFTSIADAAAEAGLGMWAKDACGAQTVPAQIVIADFEYNPAGRDAENKNGEWATIANQATEPVDLTGWVLRDESTQHRYRFPDGFSLGPGAAVRVHSGCGADTDEDLFWCAADPVWSNGGDTIILQLSDGTAVDRLRYDGDF